MARDTTGSVGNPFSLRGTVARRPFAAWGVGLSLLKYALDFALVRALEQRDMAPWEYWLPGTPQGFLRSAEITGDAALARGLLMLPFVWMGVALVLRRARDAGLSPWIVAAFFVPVVNVLCFAVLASVPGRDAAGRPDGPPARLPPATLEARPPRSFARSVGLTATLVVPLAAGTTWLATSVLAQYGVALFVGMPFALGVIATLVHGHPVPRTLGSCLGVTWTVLALAAIALVLAYVEGVLCVVMAFPLAGVVATLGTMVGCEVQWRCRQRATGPTLTGLLLMMPALVLGESAMDRPAPRSEVTTTVEVDAPPEAVWEHVIAFAELPPPTELLFRAGIAYPLRAEILGEGPGAVRHCVFSTGPFVEPIEVWDAPRRLEFSVSAQPPSMRELSPWPELAPPHLERFLVSERGRFLLEPLPGGRTRLSGTTWYSNRMWPAAYWTLWSDGVIGAIHGRVLRHIRQRAEAR